MTDNGNGCNFNPGAAQTNGAAETRRARTKQEIEQGDEKPEALPVNPDGIPVELKERPQWVCWRYEWRVGKAGKWTKLPLCARTGKAASSTDSATWSTFEEALTRLRTEAFDGIGYVFAADDPFTGVDLDSCLDLEAGLLLPWARVLLDQLDSYAETSPSRTGVKCIVRGSKPDKKCKKVYETGEVEIYDQERFFALTGARVNGCPTTINDRQAALEEVYQTVFKPVARTNGKKASRTGPKQTKPQTATGNGQPPEHGKPFCRRVIDPDKAVCNMADEELLGLARQAQNGTKFSSLYDHGDTSGHDGDNSRADLALCVMLAFWTRGDQERMDRLFRGSALCRPKWDERRGERTYGEITLDAAVELCSEVYTPTDKGSPPSGGQGDDKAQDKKPTGHSIILAHFRQRYRPFFRRGGTLYSGAVNREIKKSEACGLAGIDLINQLKEAEDAPRDRKGGVDWDSLPHFFRNWAPIAWTDLLDEAEEEEEGEEVLPSAEEEFQARVSAAMLTHVSIGYTHENGHGDMVTEVQRRTLINWCRLFARNAQWGDIRGYQLWSRKDPISGGVCVALRKELFSQVPGCADLAKLSQNKFSRLAQRYSVGISRRVRGVRVVILRADYLARLTALPAPDDEMTDDEETHAGAGARENGRTSPEETSDDAR